MKSKVIFALGLCLMISNIYATTFRPMPLEQLVEESNMAASVELKSKRVFSNEMGLIFTEFSFNVNESYNLNSSDLDNGDLKLVMAGGSLNGVTSYIDGAPTFSVGEKSFLLLKKIESRIYLSNFTMGKYKIENVDGNTFYVSSVFPQDSELGRVRKDKMIELVKLKFKITSNEEIRPSMVAEKKVFQKADKPSFEKRNPAQESFDERNSSDGVIAMWAFFGLFILSGGTIWWKLKKGSSV